MTPRSCRKNPSWRPTAALVTLGLALGLPALAGGAPAATPKNGADGAEPVTVRVGKSTIRWHLAAPPAAAKSPLIEQYQKLVAARFTGEKVAPSEKAVLDAPAGETPSAGGFSVHGRVRVPAEKVHTLFLGVDGATAVCAQGGSRPRSAAGEGEGR